MKSLKVFPYMCEQQRTDINLLLEVADEIGAAATSVATQGGHGYSSLLEARDKFKKILLESAEHYRVCIEEE